MEKQETNYKVASNGWIIAGFIFSILGGLLGMLIGIILLSGNYDKATKQKGLAMVVIGIVGSILWRAAFS